MRASLTHLTSKESWGTDEPPGENIEVLRLEGVGGPFELRLERKSDASDPFSALTPRQQEVARLAAAGMTNHDIARQLRVGDETVRSHIKAVYLRLGVESRAELTRVAVGDLVLLPE